MTSDSSHSRTDSDVFDAATGRGAASAAVVGFDVLVFAAVRYAPEYLRLLGDGPLLVGLFGTVAALLGVVYPALGSVLDRPGSGVVPVVGGLTALGLVCWLFAPQIGSDGGFSTALVFAGLFLVGTWLALDVDAGLWTLVPTRVSAHVPRGLGHERASRYAAIVVGLPAVVWVLVEVSPARPAIQVVFGLAAGVGLTATTLLAVHDCSVAAIPTTHDDRTTPETRLRDALGAFRALPRASRHLLVGETLVAAAVGGVSVFLVITVTSVLRVDVTLLGHRFRPDAVFGICLFAETLVALVATRPLERLARWVGRGRVVGAVLLVAALFPVALVGAPANPAVVVALFAAFGLYRAGRPLCRRAVESPLEPSQVAQYRPLLAVVYVPSALVGGLLYTASPTLAFGLATVLGTVGVREFVVGTTWPATRSDVE